MNNLIIFVIAIVLLIVGIILIKIEVETDNKSVKKIRESIGWTVAILGAFGILPQIGDWVRNDSGGIETTPPTSIVTTITTANDTTIPIITTQTTTTTLPIPAATQMTTTVANNTTTSTTTTTTFSRKDDYIEYSNAVYEGYTVNGIPSGEGTMRWHIGDIYVGNWVNGSRTGYGVYTFASGNKYEGYFSNGEFNGKGTLVFENGEILSGTWEYGEFIQDTDISLNDDSISDEMTAAISLFKRVYSNNDIIGVYSKQTNSFEKTITYRFYTYDLSINANTGDKVYVVIYDPSTNKFVRKTVTVNKDNEIAFASKYSGIILFSLSPFTK